MEAIQTMASEMLVNVALGVLTLLAAYAMYYIRVGAERVRAQTAQIEDAGTRALLENALSDVERLAMVSVGAMEQTVAGTLREAVRSGAAGRDELVALGKQAFDEVKTAIAPEAQQVIRDNLGDFDAYLTRCIEDAVRRVKQEDPYLTLPSGDWS